MSKAPSRRTHARFACDLPVEVYSPLDSAKLGDARLLDLSMGGGAVRGELKLRTRQPYEFRFNWGAERLSVLGQVVWAAEEPAARSREARFGVRFSLTAQQESLLRSLVGRLKDQGRG